MPGATENAGVENAIRAKLQGWKVQEWKIQEQIAGGGKCRSGKCESTSQGWTGKCRSKYKHVYILRVVLKHELLHETRHYNH